MGLPIKLSRSRVFFLKQQDEGKLTIAIVNKKYHLMEIFF